MSKNAPYTLLSFATRITDHPYSDSELKQLRLHESAEKRVKGNHIRYSLKRLQQSAFWKANSYLFLQRKGIGYWLWKPYIIKEALDSMQDGEVLIYCDGSFYFIDTPLALQQYIDQETGLGFFVDGNHSLGQIIHDSAIEKLNIQEDILSGKVIIAGLIVIRKSQKSVDFITRWLALCIQPLLLMDDSKRSGRSDFKKHKNDMALLTYMVHQAHTPYSVPPTITYHSGFLDDNSAFPGMVLNWDKNGFGCKRPLNHFLRPDYIWSFFKKKISHNSGFN